MDDFSSFFGAMAGFGIILAVVWFIFTVLMVILAIWIQYTIIWKAVRRGMREFHGLGKYGAPMMTQTVQQPVAPPNP